jgi:hypothetical protein
VDETRFGQKLDYLKTTFRVTDSEIGDSVGAVASLVCRWRSGERSLDPDKQAHTVRQLAAFFIERATLKRQRPRLAKILSLEEADIETESEACVDALIDFLYDGKAIHSTGGADTPKKLSIISDGSFIGVQGVMDALALLGECVQGRPDAAITVYLSLDYSRLFQDEATFGIWDLLCRMNRGEPVRVVFDGWLDDTERVAQNLNALLPFMQAGKLQLAMIKSTQKFFYYNLTFFAKGAGMILTTEPVGGEGVCISLLTTVPDYLDGMSAVFAGIDRRGKNLARHIGKNSAKDVALYYGRLFEPPEDLQVLSGGVNLLYMDEDSYLSLLKLNGITGSQRGYRHTRFVEDKRLFESFLVEHRIKEIMSLPALERMIRERKIETPDFSFHDGEVRADEAILRSLLEGMLRYLERYENLSIYLERSAAFSPDFTCRIKGDSFILLHTRESGGTHTVYSDNWMLVYSYIKRFQEALRSDQLMNMRTAVRTALRVQLENLGD